MTQLSTSLGFYPTLSTRRRTGSGSPLAALVLAMAFGASLMVYPLLMGTHASLGPLFSAAASGAMLCVLLLHQRSHSAWNERLACIQQFRLGQPRARESASRATPAAAGTPSASMPEHADGQADLTELRTMRLHIKALESALEEQSTQVHELRQALDREQARPEHEDVLRMLVTINGLRDGMTADPAAERVLGRVEAAIRRLASSELLARTELPVPATTVAAPAAPQVEEPAVEDAAPADTPATPVTPPTPITGAEQPVLPVPAPPVDEPLQRRRWLRGKAA